MRGHCNVPVAATSQPDELRLARLCLKVVAASPYRARAFGLRLRINALQFPHEIFLFGSIAPDPPFLAI